MRVPAAAAHVELAGVGSCSCDCRCQHDRFSRALPAPVLGSVSTAEQKHYHTNTSRVHITTSSVEQPADIAAAAKGNSSFYNSISSLLQQAGPSITNLQKLLQVELSDVACDKVKLGRIRHLIEQHQGNGKTNVAAATAAESLHGHEQQLQQQQPWQQTVHVLPLLGLTLMQLLHLLTQYTKQQGQAGESVSQDHHPLLLQLLKPGSTPLSAALYHSRSNGEDHSSSSSSDSKFLCALASEILRIRRVVKCCYQVLLQNVANIGQHLPAVPEAASCDDCNAKGGSSRRQSQASADDASAPAAPATSQTEGGQRTSATSDAHHCSSQAAYKGLSIVNLSVLHDLASSVSSELVKLDDFVTSSYKQLANLAQQYDTLLTAAALDACTRTQSSTAACAPVPRTAADGGSKPTDSKSSSRISLLGLLAGRRHHQQHQKSKGVNRSDSSCSMSAPPGSCGASFVLLTLGVASHSSDHPQAQHYTAGVAPDIYQQTTHKLITADHSSEAALWGLSVIYARIRHAAETAAAAAAEPAGAGAAAAAAEWTAPDQFTRSTTKYWVHPSNILRLKLALLRHLPLLVYGAADPVYRGDIDSSEAVRQGSKGATSLVSSVYFDSPDLAVYHTRLAREDGARLVRFRYYGPREPGTAGQQQPVFVERKTHRQKWTGNRSIKERAGLVQGQVSGYLSGTRSPAKLSNKETKEQLLTEVLDFINTTHMAPAVRTEYMRTAWQRYDSNNVRLSLDEHMLLLREKGTIAPSQPAASGAPAARAGRCGNETADAWCASLEPAAQLPAGDVVRFPYGVLEIKLQEQEPEWIQELKESGILVECPKFSKFLHGMALLYPERCAASPRWFIWDDDAGVAAPATLDTLRDINQPQGAADEEVKAELTDTRDRSCNMTTTTAPAQQLTAAAAAATAGAAAAELLPLSSLSPLKIPRRHQGSNVSAAAAGLVPASASQAQRINSYAIPLQHSNSNGSQHLGNHCTVPGAAAAAAKATATTGTGGPAVTSDAVCSTRHAELASWVPSKSNPTATAQVLAPCNSDDVLWGAGLHTPRVNSLCASQPGSPSSAKGFETGGGRCAAARGIAGGTKHAAGTAGQRCSVFTGGSGPFNAGINSNGGITVHHHHQSNSSPRAHDTAALLPESFQYSHSHKLRQQQGLVGALAASAGSSYTSHAVHDIIINQPQLAAAAAGCSFTSTGGGHSTASVGGSGIRRLVGLMIGMGKRERSSSSSDQQVKECADIQREKQDGPAHGHHTLYVTNPLEHYHLHGGHPHHHTHYHHQQHGCLSSCSTSSADTCTTGSAAAARRCHSPHSRTNSSLGMPSINGSTPTIAAAGGAGAGDEVAGRLPLLPTSTAPGMGKLGSHGSNSTDSSWQLTTEPPIDINLLHIKGLWDSPLDCLSAPAGTAADASCHPDQKPAATAAGQVLTDSGWGLIRNLGLCQDKSGRGLRGLDTCKDTARGLGLPSLLSQQVSMAGEQQHHIIQINHVRMADSASQQPWLADQLADSAAAAAGNVAPNQEPCFIDDLQQYLPPAPVSGSRAVAQSPVAAGLAASTDDGRLASGVEVHIVGGGSSSGEAGTVGQVKAKRSRARVLLQQIKAAAGRGRWRGKARSPAGGGAGGGGGRNEHLLGFSGSAPRTKAMVRARAEPKTFFANERTFLSWLQISVLVMMTGLGLLGGSSLAVKGGEAGEAINCMDSMVCKASRVSGAIIAPVSVLFMLYALYTFKKRTHQIRHQMTAVRYDDQLGPVLLTTLLVGVTIVSIALALKSFMSQ